MISVALYYNPFRIARPYCIPLPLWHNSDNRFAGQLLQEALLSDIEPIAFRPRRVGPEREIAGSLTQPSAPPNPIVRFDRRELDQILRLYGRMVAAGEWRDYAIDMLKDRAVFSIYRRTSEFPLYRIEKNPRLARRQGAYSAIAATGLILKRGQDLSRVLAVLEKGPRLVEH